jgi:hypothetical protein
MERRERLPDEALEEPRSEKAAMKTIFADFNALTESEHIRLTSRASQDDLRETGAQPGDWVWLIDGELKVGARLALDSTYKLVGVPDWETLVELDGGEATDDRG